MKALIMGWIKMGNAVKGTPEPRNKHVELETKIAPSQDRSRATFEAILTVSGELLGEVGIERLSTNMIARRAGMTPPSLYRYFPNKYAILHEMGRRVLAAEDAIVLDWLTAGGADGLASVEEIAARNVEMLREVRQAVRNQPGGVWILRVMRAVPVLREVRAASLQLVADALYARLLAASPATDPARLRAATLLITNLTSAANEMMIDDPSLEQSIAGELARMVALYSHDLLFGASDGRDAVL